MEVSYAQPADLNAIRSTVASLGINDVQVQNFGTARDVLIRMPVQKGSSFGAAKRAGDGRAEGGRRQRDLAPHRVRGPAGG